jgi:YVTN family beta-propeller protein
VYDKVYVANSSPSDRPSTVTVIDGTTDLIAATVGVGMGPRAFCLNPEQHRVYVANTSNSSISVVCTAPPGIEERQGLRVSNPEPLATVVRGVLVLEAVESRRHAAYRAELLDISGRKVLSLHPGANDVRKLAPGVYFVREEPQAASRKPQAVLKVVVTR